MENLKKIIQKNREFIDVYEPNEDHFKKFKQKLKKTNTSTNFRLNFKNILLFAAGFVLIFSVSLLLKYNFSDNRLPQVSDLSVELNEMENYYQLQLNDKIKELNRLNKQNKIDQSSYNQELASLNKEYQQLQQDLENTQYDERIVSAMVNNYQTRINLIETIIKSIKTYCH